MTDTEFQAQVRRGLIMLLRAFMARYALTWADFLPREENAIIRALAEKDARSAQLDYTCFQHQTRRIMATLPNWMLLDCGCEYQFVGLEWVKKEKLAPQPET